MQLRYQTHCSACCGTHPASQHPCFISLPTPVVLRSPGSAPPPPHACMAVRRRVVLRCERRTLCGGDACRAGAAGRSCGRPGPWRTGSWTKEAFRLRPGASWLCWLVKKIGAASASNAAAAGAVALPAPERTSAMFCWRGALPAMPERSSLDAASAHAGTTSAHAHSSQLGAFASLASSDACCTLPCTAYPVYVIGYIPILYALCMCAAQAGTVQRVS